MPVQDMAAEPSHPPGMPALSALPATVPGMVPQQAPAPSQGAHPPPYLMPPQPPAGPKVDPPKPFRGDRLDGSAVDTWVFQMELYFANEPRIPRSGRAKRAALNMEGDAAVWL